jgi:hypothetical protein
MTERSTGRVRASDAEREKISAILQHAMSEGRLTFSEGEERIGTVYKATYRDELPRLTADLPPPDSAPSGAASPRRDHRDVLIVGLVALAAMAVIAGWVLSRSPFLLPAIPLGVMAAMLIMRRRRHWHARDSTPPLASRGGGTASTADRRPGPGCR